MPQILVVDDEEYTRNVIKIILDGEGYDSIFSDSGRKAIELVRNNDVSLVLLDLKLPDIHGLDVLSRIKEINPDLTVIIITGYADVESAVEAMKKGAYDYLKKPVKADALKLVIRLILETQVLKREVRFLRDQENKSNIVIVSPLMEKVFTQIREVVKHSDVPILIQGETGTGKNVVAREINKVSGGPFVEINCASIPETLLESELFGYEEGAFTGAKRRKSGLLEHARGGILFLDEIGSLPYNLQGKILHVIDNRIFRRLGGKKEIPLEARIVAATNRCLESEISEGRFRQDLFYRLNVFPIILPPLRERQSAILNLIDHFILSHAMKYQKPVVNISQQAIEMLQKYSWPGNVRELHNVIERILISYPQLEIIDSSNLPLEIRKEFNKVEDISDISLELNENSLGEAEKRLSKALIKSALDQANGNISRAAKILKVPRSTLRYRIEKFDIVKDKI